MSNEWDANLQAIGNIFDRDRAEIARKSEVIEKLSDKLQDRDDRIEFLENEVIERLAEINEKDALLEKARLLDISRCRNIGILETALAESYETVKRLQANYGIPA